MLLVAKRRYKKQYGIEKAGIFDTGAGFFKKLFVSNAARQITSTALSAGKDAAKEIGKKALDVGKTVAIDAGKQLIDKAAAKIMKPTAPTTVFTQESKDVLTRLINDGARLDNNNNINNNNNNNNNNNINNVMMGHGVNPPVTTKNAIRIQDLVRRLNGGGLKVV